MIKWETPPPRRTGEKGVWRERLLPLIEHPGRWANLGRHKMGTSTQINQGRYGGFQAGEFEATTRETDRATGTAVLYVRYVGSENGSAS